MDVPNKHNVTPKIAFAWKILAVNLAGSIINGCVQEIKLLHYGRVLGRGIDV